MSDDPEARHLSVDGAVGHACGVGEVADVAVYLEGERTDADRLRELWHSSDYWWMIEHGEIHFFETETTFEEAEGVFRDE